MLIFEILTKNTQFLNFQINVSEKQLSTKISQKHKNNENKNYSGFVIHVKLLNLTDEYLPGILKTA
jgi:hypothetical protein